MGELETKEELNIDTSVDTANSVKSVEEIPLEESTSTELTEYKEVEEPCVALTIIGENRLTDAEVFVRRGIRYTIKAFFSTLVLTIMNLFI
jgi:hypothetical protein